MGGKGSGRHEKPLSEVLVEVTCEIFEVNELIIDPYINRKLGNLVARLSYHLSKLESDE